MSGNFCFSFVFGYGNVDNEVEHRKNKNYLSRLVSFLCHCYARLTPSYLRAWNSLASTSDTALLSPLIYRQKLKELRISKRHLD